eukprot:gene7021-4979_t
MSLNISLFGHTLPNPFMNAAGVLCYSLEDLTSLSTSSAGSLVTKSCTPQHRPGNPEPRYMDLPLGSINSMGLPNQGFEFYLNYASQQHQYDKKPLLFLSMSGLSLEENKTMCQKLKTLVDQQRQANPRHTVLLELNLSCPNVPGKPQLAYDFAAMRQTLETVTAVYTHPFGIKLPPYFDMAHFDMAAEVLNDFPSVAFITCINSVGNGLMIDIDTETVLIKPKNGFGGLGGQYVLPTALANVNAFYRRCPNKMVFGCGGVSSGKEAFLHILAGAHMVQVGTALHEEGPAIFDRLQAELREIMQKKGYQSMNDFRGKVKTLD